MSEGYDRAKLHEEMDITTAGKWYIAELGDPQLVAQGESEAEARDKLIKRYEEYTSSSPETPTIPDTPDPRKHDSGLTWVGDGE